VLSSKEMLQIWNIIRMFACVTVSADDMCYVASSYYETLGSYLPAHGYVDLAVNLYLGHFETSLIGW